MTYLSELFACLFAGSAESCRKAALSGDVAAQYRMGRMHEMGLKVPHDEEEAARWYQRAAKRGHAMAQYRLGRMYASGRGVLPRDPQQAAMWLRLASEQCVSGARRAYLRILKDTTRQASRQKVETQHDNRLAAPVETSSSSSPTPTKRPPIRRSTSFLLALFVILLSMVLQIGNEFLVSKRDDRSGKPSGTTARPTLKESKTPPQAKRGISPGQLKALILLAKQGNVEAQWRLGRLYGSKEGLLQNDEKAVFWYNKAAQKGYAPAQYSLGWMYEHGRGVAQNGEQALFWYRKAAEQGLQKARDKIDALQKNSP
ncbi:MAG: sel1 repeat family protein [bacterium]|nr:sel1 repeat family protein [bacterium]